MANCMSLPPQFGDGDEAGGGEVGRARARESERSGGVGIVDSEILPWI